MAHVKVFADKQTDKRTDQKLYAPDLSIRGHKNRDHLKTPAIVRCPFTIDKNYSSYVH